MKSTEIEAEQVVSTSGLLTGRPNASSPQRVSGVAADSRPHEDFLPPRFWHADISTAALPPLVFRLKLSPPSSRPHGVRCTLYTVQLPHRCTPHRQTHVHPLGGGERVSAPFITRPLCPGSSCLLPEPVTPRHRDNIGCNDRRAASRRFKPMSGLLEGICANDSKPTSPPRRAQRTLHRLVYHPPLLPLLRLCAFIEL